MVLGPIPWNAIHEYAVFKGYAEDEVLYDDFMYVIQQIDVEYLEFQGEEAGKKLARARAKV